MLSLEVCAQITERFGMQEKEVCLQPESPIMKLLLSHKISGWMHSPTHFQFPMPSFGREDLGYCNFSRWPGRKLGFFLKQGIFCPRVQFFPAERQLHLTTWKPRGES